MKRFLPFVLLLVIIQFSSCEKDDICVAGDTPVLMLGFFNYEDPDTEKSVPNLRSVETELNVVVNTVGAKTSDSLPLRIETNNSTFVLTNNYSQATDGTVSGNSDTITFNYTVQEEFLSRACGFIANYNELSYTLSNDSANWIDSVAVVETTVKRDTLIHVKIFH
ncbi:DUF6452 family protein [Croceivirga sp. JEA036]|uniref:DUF6452 family protein n=1 Tax=Croceivirga sp. JEA036 TaxID=2721162 RepID=UPI00143C62EA|nr:DUF6452 family protein [Croceivirga sp. JEA036]NJB37543.1 hypothetical protein [Croceivirga sp. JEA036]